MRACVRVCVVRRACVHEYVCGCVRVRLRVTVCCAGVCACVIMVHISRPLFIIKLLQPVKFIQPFTRRNKLIKSADFHIMS